jgi:UDP-galactopyranose mutase
MAQSKIAIVGAGLAGATIAYQLSGRGYNLNIFDQRTHLAGNVHTERDPETGVMVHKYGPHIFHTDNAAVWKFVRQFATFVPYVQRTKGIARGEIFSLPINLHTINQFFCRDFSPAAAEQFVRGHLVNWDHEKTPANFEELALASVGPELYGAFLRDYTRKQWGREPSSLPAAILKRLPLRFDYNDNAFFHRYQGIPKQGYTAMVADMLDLPDLTLHWGSKFKRADADSFDHVFYSGPIDEWFDYRLGRLPYRTLDFTTIRAQGNFQGCSVINNCDIGTPWTRSTEHKHFTPWEPRDRTVVTREYPREAKEGDVLFYPVRLAEGQSKLLEYQALAEKEAGVSFVGRLGTFQYLDMDATIAASLQIAKDFHRTVSKAAFLRS